MRRCCLPFFSFLKWSLMKLRLASDLLGSWGLNLRFSYFCPVSAGVAGIFAMFVSSSAKNEAQREVGVKQASSQLNCAPSLSSIPHPILKSLSDRANGDLGPQRPVAATKTKESVSTEALYPAAILKSQQKFWKCALEFSECTRW